MKKTLKIKLDNYNDAHAIAKALANNEYDVALQTPVKKDTTIPDCYYIILQEIEHVEKEECKCVEIRPYWMTEEYDDGREWFSEKHRIGR